MRNFIMLSESDKEYRNNVRKSTAGYSRIEIKNKRLKVLTHVQNLKPLTGDDRVYKAYLIGKDGTGIFSINSGTFNVDQSGRGECIFEADSSDIKKTGHSADNIKAIVVVCQQVGSVESPPLGYCLNGYIDKNEDIDWKAAFAKDKNIERPKVKQQVQTKEQQDVLQEQDLDQQEVRGEIEQEIEQKVEQKSEQEIKLEQQEQIVETEDEDSSYPDIDDLLDIVNRGISYKSEHDEQQEQQDIEPENKKKQAEITDRDNIHQENKYRDFLKSETSREQVYGRYNRFWDDIENYFTDLFAFYNKVEPFAQRLEGYDWRKIDLASIGFNGIYSVVPAYYYMYNSNLSRYRHYLLGIAYKDRKVKYVVYGLPGTNCKEEQPYGGKTGYVYWQPVEKDCLNREEDFGYWLLHIDADTGEVVNPLGTTKV